METEMVVSAARLFFRSTSAPSGSFPRIARCHDLRALPEQRLRCFFSPMLRCLVVHVFLKFVGNVIGPCCTHVAINLLNLSPVLTNL
jgi:hypothetical protein